ADLRRALASLAFANAPGESRFRVLLCDSDGTVYVIVQPFTPLSREVYERGVKVVTAALTRHDPRLKDSSFIAESRSARAKVGGEIFEVLLTHKGRIFEGMTSNFYAVALSVIARVYSPEAISSTARGLLRREERPPRNDGILITARQGILLGVTRRAVLRLARGLGLSIQYRPPRLEEEFAEAFLTSSSRGVVPIVSIDNRQVGEGKPGKWTKALSWAYQTYVAEHSEPL
ncbi:MAG: aminotransferase class IV, partial [Chloroflexota bacterium]